MARGVICSGATEEEAVRDLLTNYPHLTVVGAKRIDMATVQEHAYSKIGNDFWVIVVEGAKLPDQEDPIGETEAGFVREMGGFMRRAHGA